MLVVASSVTACSWLFAISDDAAAGRDEGGTGAEGSTTTDEDGSANGDGGLDAGIVCPQGKPGPPLVSAGGFCIDRTEVTAAQYGAFLTSDKSALTLPADCAGDAGFAPRVAAPGDDYPVLGNWCAAFAYCQWAGKRLCGALNDGGPLPLTNTDISAVKDPDRNEWVAACAGPQHWMYPYGNDLHPDACAPAQQLGGGPSPYYGMTPVGAHPTCTASSGALDLVGNANEWVNASLSISQYVDGSPQAMNLYYYMGGDDCRAFNGGGEALSPATIGIRCCWSP